MRIVGNYDAGNVDKIRVCEGEGERGSDMGSERTAPGILAKFRPVSVN